MEQFPTSRAALLQDPLFVLCLFAIAYCLGRRLVALLVAAKGPAPEREVVSLLVGLGLLQYVPYGLGMAGALTPRNLWIVTGALALLAAFDLTRLVRARRGQGAREARAALSLDLRVYGAIALVTLAISLVVSLAPPTDPDGLFYHLTAPKRWLQSGDLRYLPSLVHTNGPMGGQMLFTWAIGIWSDTSTKLIHFSFGVVALAIIIVLGERLGSRRAGVVAACSWLLGLNFLGTLGATSLYSVAYVDLNLAAFSLGSVLALLVYFRERDFGWALVSALCAGFALTTKLTGLFVGGSLTVFFAAVSLLEKESWGRTLGRTVLFGTLALLPALPWFARAWSQTGSPIYLMLAGALETRDWSPSAGRAFGDFFKYYVWGTGFSSRDWSLELRKSIRLGALVVALGAGAFAIYRAKTTEKRLLVFVFLGVALASIAGTGLYLRYLVPFSGLVFVAAIASIPERFLAHRAFTGVLSVWLVANLGVFLKQNYPKPVDALRVTLGLMGREQFKEMAFGETNELWREVNQRTTKQDQIILAAGRPAYYMTPHCLITEAYYQERLRMDTWENYLSDVQRDRPALLIVSLRTELSNPVGPAYAAADNEMPFARRLAREHGQKIGQYGDDELYQLSF